MSTKEAFEVIVKAAVQRLPSHQKLFTMTMVLTDDEYDSAIIDADVALTYDARVIKDRWDLID